MIYNYESKVFGAASVTIESSLKNPNQFREAVILETIRSLPEEKRKEFLKSEEAKLMLSEGFISDDGMENLNSCDEMDNIHKMAVCHVAKESEDPLWDELMRARMEERRIFNALIEKYGAEAKTFAENANKDFVNKYVPEYFRK